MEDKKYRCPRCRREKVLDRGELIKCVRCDLEFSKNDMEEFIEENVLAISEKDSILKVLLDKFDEN